MLESGKRFIEEFMNYISKAENMRMLSLQIHYLVFLAIVAGVLITIILLKRAISELKYIIYKNKYEKTTYYEQTKVPYNVIMNPNDDEGKGRRGEYLISLELNEFEKKGAKLLFNSYLPKKNSQYGEFSEVDVILIHSTGIYVIESKNYEGFIWGNEEQERWCQVVQRRIRKSKKIIRSSYPFYNPIWQNQTHIESLERVINENESWKKIPIYSLVVFSDRGILKSSVKNKNGKVKNIDGIKIENSAMLRVVNTRYVCETIKQMGKKSKKALNTADIEQIYKILEPYTQGTKEISLQHISEIKKKKYMQNRNSYKS